MLIKAFITEFNKDEKVNLVIKTSEGYTKLIPETVQTIKSTIRFKNEYPRIYLYGNHLSNTEMINFHKTMDCLVMPSSAECPSRPVIDAICCGNSTLVTSNTGMCDLPVFDTIDSYTDYCDCPKPPFPFIYTGKETWQIPVVKDLARKMRRIYELRKGQPKLEVSPLIKQYDITTVGEKIKCRLEI